MDAAAELGRNPVRKHQIQSEYGDEQADAGRDCRIRHARPNSNVDREMLIFLVQLTTCRIGNFTRLILTPAILHIYIYIYVPNKRRTISSLVHKIRLHGR